MGVSILAALSTTPITKKALAEKLATSSREVELMIHAARLEGAPICSDDRGYWLGTAAEVAECARRLRSRYINQALTARALRRAAARMERQLEQETLWAA
jgi:cell division septum initiation protein DivIVA